MTRFLCGIILVASVSASPSWAGSYQLFSKTGRRTAPSADYQEIVDHLKYGDTVVFSSGRKFRVGKLLGTGNTTLIFALVGDQKHVLRVPKTVGRWLRPGDTRPQNFDTEEFIDWFVDGVNEAERSHIPVVHIEESLSHEYIEVERLEGDMVSFGDFFASFDRYGKNEREEMVQAMDRFLAKSANKSSVMDLHDGNLVYLPHRTEWIISDVSSGATEFDASKRITTRSRSVLNDLTEFLDIPKGSSFDQQISEWRKLVAQVRRGECDSALLPQNPR
jgi:hypothetical protein